MAISDNALVTLNEVKQFYFNDISNSKAQVDDLLEELINRISIQFQEHCNRDSFFANDYVEYVNSCVCDIFVKNIPINSIVSIHNDSNWEWTDDTLVDTTEYRIIDSRYILFKNRLYNKSDKSIKVSYNGGYSEIPADLKHACIKEVVREYKHVKDFDVISGTQSESGSDQSNTFLPSGLMPGTKQILNKYRRL